MGNNDSPGDEVDQSEAIRQLVASRNDPAALEAALAEHRGRLRRMVALRLDRRLQGRIDPSDVIRTEAESVLAGPTEELPDDVFDGPRS